MALDDASDPFQQVVYLQEGDAPPERLVVSYRTLEDNYTDENLVIKIYNASDFSIYKEYTLDGATYFYNSAFGKSEVEIDGSLVCDQLGSIYYISGDEDNGACYYRVHKIDTNTDSITTLVGPRVTGVNDKEPKVAIGIYSNGYLFITDAINVVKINATSMTEVDRKQIPAQSWPEVVRRQYISIIGDDSSCFICEAITWSERKNEDQNRFHTRIYEVNTSNLSLNVLVNENFYNNRDYAGYLLLNSRGGVVINGEPYFIVSDYYQYRDRQFPGYDQYEFNDYIYRVYTSNGYQYELIPLRGSLIRYAVSQFNGNLLVVWRGDPSPIAEYDPITGNLVRTVDGSEYFRDLEIEATNNNIYVFYENTNRPFPLKLQQYDGANISETKSITYYEPPGITDLRKSTRNMAMFHSPRYT